MSVHWGGRGPGHVSRSTSASGSATPEINALLREDGSFVLREDGSILLREDPIAAMATPTLTNSSVLGAAPLILSVSDTDYTAGLYLQLQIDQTSNAFSNLTQNLVFLVDGASWSALDEAIGLVTPSGQYWARVRAVRDNDSGGTTVTGTDPSTASVSFLADVSSWSTTFTDTIVSSVTQFATVNGFNKSSWLTPSGGNKTVAGTANLSEGASIRADHVAATSTAWVDVTLNTIAVSTTKTFAFSIEDGTTDLTLTNVGRGTSGEPGYGTGGAVSFRFAEGASQSIAHWTGAGFTGGDFVAPSSGQFQITDVFRVWIDTTGHIGRLYRNRSGAGFLQWGSDFTLPTLSSYNFTVTMFDGQNVTCDFTGWA